MKKKNDWMKGAVKNPGAFTKYCGGKVTDKCIAKAEKKGGKIAKEATLAKTFRKIAKTKDKKKK